MVVNTEVNGSTITWMVSEFTLGKMAENMKENTKTIRNKATECIHGQTDACIKVIGGVVNNMALETIQFRDKQSSLDFGKKANA